MRKCFAIQRHRRCRVGGRTTLLTALLCFFALEVGAQSSSGEACNVVRFFPFPLNAEQALTAQVSRLCPQSTPFLEAVEASVLGSTIRIETACRFTPLPTISCQVGQAEIGVLASGEYAVEVVDRDSGDLLFSDSLTVGRVTSIPTLTRPGITVLVLLLGVAAWTCARQSGRSRFSNNRS